VVRIPTIGLNDEQRNAMVFGKELFISFEGKAMHFFDPESEKNLLVDITNADAYELDADIIHQEQQEEFLCVLLYRQREHYGCCLCYC